MTEERIGRWVVRQRAGVPMGVPHFTESVVRDQPVTRCGRRLSTRAGTSFRYLSPAEFGVRCKQCVRP